MNQLFMLYFAETPSMTHTADMVYAKQCFKEEFVRASNSSKYSDEQSLAQC